MILAALTGTLVGTIELMLIGILDLASNPWAMFCNLIAWVGVVITVAMHFGIFLAIIFGIFFVLSMIVIMVEKEKERIAILNKSISRI